MNDADDGLPLNPNETEDTDGDGVGNNATLTMIMTDFLIKTKQRTTLILKILIVMVMDY